MNGADGIMFLALTSYIRMYEVSKRTAHILSVVAKGGWGSTSYVKITAFESFQIKLIELLSFPRLLNNYWSVRFYEE